MHEGYDKNEYGTKISKHKCDVCGEPYTLCPAQYKDWPCQLPHCASYDPNTDADVLFMSDEEIAKKKIVGMDMLRARKAGVQVEPIEDKTND